MRAAMMLPDDESRPKAAPGGLLAGNEIDSTAPVSRSAGRIDWGHVLNRAADIVRSYDTPVTLRQLFYRLVSEQLIPNKDTSYKRLSSVTAEARRAGDFPELVDRGRQIHRPLHFADIRDALDDVLDWYRLDRTRGQEVSVYLAVEKAGIVNQLTDWFGDRGIPVLALGGYASHTYVTDVRHDVTGQQRPAVLLYAGDFDPSGEDIDRDFVARTDCWNKVVRVALSAEQVRQYRLPPNPGKSSDSRAAGFVERHGELVQVELDALDPAVLRQLFADAVAEFWDKSAYQDVMARETADRNRLTALIGGRHD